MSDIQTQTSINRRYANRGVAVAFSWLGGFCSIMPVFVWSLIWGDQGDIGLIGGHVNALILGCVLATIAGVIICVGCAIAIMLHPRVRPSHAKRLNTATFLGGICAFWGAIGIWRFSDFADSALILVSMMLMCATLLEMVLLHGMRRRGMIASPADGVCPNCEYPIGTSLVCTECGKPVSPNKPAV